MDLYRSVRAVTAASGEGAVDWDAVSEAAKAGTDPGSLELTAADRAGYAADVRAARGRLRELSGTEFDVPNSLTVQNRYHWIDANVDTFRRVMEPIEDEVETLFPNVSRVANTGTMAATLGFLARHVLGQYDPLLLADDPADHGLYFVDPNIRRVAGELDVGYERFRRWIAFHEVAHAAEFGAAPWLPDYLESRLESGVRTLSRGGIDREAFVELDAAMTAVEGYAELLMDRAFDEAYADLRRKVDERRSGGGPVGQLVRRLLGMGLKRRQYERGTRFFETVVEKRGLEAAGTVWERPENLPTGGELDRPELWIERVDPS
ncbi:MAG: zinc-dependent metalloprotease [Haloferacaceae archaeon]